MDSKTVLHIADIIKLHVSESEIASFCNDLEKRLKLAEQLQNVDTKGVEPVFCAAFDKPVLRKDVEHEPLSVEELAKMSPKQFDPEAPGYRVPNVF